MANYDTIMNNTSDFLYLFKCIFLHVSETVNNEEILTN